MQCSKALHQLWFVYPQRWRKTVLAKSADSTIPNTSNSPKRRVLSLWPEGASIIGSRPLRSAITTKGNRTLSPTTRLPIQPRPLPLPVTRGARLYLSTSRSLAGVSTPYKNPRPWVIRRNLGSPNMPKNCKNQDAVIPERMLRYRDARSSLPDRSITSGKSRIQGLVRKPWFARSQTPRLVCSFTRQDPERQAKQRLLLDSAMHPV